MNQRLSTNFKFNDALVALREPKYTLKDLGVTSRVMSNWQQKGLLIDGLIAEDRKWRRFNLTELVWFKIIKELRKIGVPLKRIKELSQWLKVETVKLNHLMDLKERIIILDTLEFFILYALIARLPIYFLFFTSESIVPFTVYIPHENFRNIKDLEKFYDEFKKLERTKLPAYLVKHQTHVSVSLTTILKGFIADNKYESLVRDFGLLNDNELELLHYIRQGNLTEVHIKFDENNEISLLELTELRTNVQKEARLLDYIMAGDYQDITYTTQNGKIVKFENTIKVKFKKK